MSAGIAILAGLLMAAGLVLMVRAIVPAPPRLVAALERAGGVVDQTALLDVGTVGSTSERLGAYVYRHTPVPLTEKTRQNLRLQNKAIAEFYADKVVLMIVGAMIPVVLMLIISLTTGRTTLLPAFITPVSAALGFFVPDLRLRGGSSARRADAVESLLVFIDLVTLERLANASATQALHNAAELSDAPLFVQMRVALERARLEQQSPYAEIRRLADQLNLPELVDLADVLQLDETGAALSGALRARLHELRDAHLSQEQVSASAASEGMTLYMTLPVFVFGSIFMGAVFLKLVFGG